MPRFLPASNIEQWVPENFDIGMRYLSLIVICASTLLFKVLPAPAVKTGDAQKAEFTNRPNSGPKRPHIIVIVADDLVSVSTLLHPSSKSE